MDRLEAYTIARKELEALGAGPAGALRRLVGCPAAREVRGESGAGYSVETTAEGSSQAEEAVVVRVTVNGSSTWKLERLEERIVVRL